jgi:hypothetical protein
MVDDETKKRLTNKAAGGLGAIGRAAAQFEAHAELIGEHAKELAGAIGELTGAFRSAAEASNRSSARMASLTKVLVGVTIAYTILTGAGLAVADDGSVRRPEVWGSICTTARGSGPASTRRRCGVAARRPARSTSSARSMKRLPVAVRCAEGSAAQRREDVWRGEIREHPLGAGRPERGRRRIRGSRGRCAQRSSRVRPTRAGEIATAARFIAGTGTLRGKRQKSRLPALRLRA